MNKCIKYDCQRRRSYEKEQMTKTVTVADYIHGTIIDPYGSEVSQPSNDLEAASDRVFRASATVARLCQVMADRGILDIDEILKVSGFVKHGYDSISNDPCEENHELVDGP